MTKKNVIMDSSKVKIIHSLYFHINLSIDTNLFSSNKNILLMFPQSYPTQTKKIFALGQLYCLDGQIIIKIIHVSWSTNKTKLR